VLGVDSTPFFFNASCVAGKACARAAAAFGHVAPQNARSDQFGPSDPP
jgi:hypothetical protein